MLNSRRQKRGMMIVEVLIYIFLLSFLLSGFLTFAYMSQDRNYELINEINDAYE